MKEPSAPDRRAAALMAENRKLKAEVCHLRIRLMKEEVSARR